MISISLKNVNPNIEDMKDRKNAFADAFISKIIKEDELINYLNRYHLCTATFKDDYRNSNNIKTVAPLIKIDIDDESNYQIVLGLLNMSGYKYVKVPSASYEENKLHKLHILVFTQKPLSINPSIYSYQVDNFLYHLGINPKWIDYKVSINPVSYFAPYRAKFGKIDFNNNETIEHFEIIDDEVSELIEGDYASIIDEVEIPKEFKNHNVQSGYILPSVTDGKIYSLDELNSSDKATYLKLEGFIPYKGEIVSIKEVSSLIWAENDNTKRYSNFGCPVCNKNHTMDSISTSYAFAYISKNGEIIIQCNGNSCSEKPLYIIPNQEIKELFDIETGMSISKPVVGSSYLIDNVEQQCINEYKNSFNFMGGYKFVLKENELQTQIINNPLELLDKEVLGLDYISNLKDLEMLVDGLIVHNQMTMIYAPSNVGKTTATIGIIHFILKKYHEKSCYYLDYDNGANTMKPHLIKILTHINNFKYLSYENTEKNKLFNILDNLIDLSKVIFVFDSLQHFVNGDISNPKSEPEVKALFERFKALRKKGATIVIISHTTKEKNASGKETTFRGLNIIKDNLDNMFYLDRKDDKTYLLKNEKKRHSEIKPFTTIKYNHDEVLISKVEGISSEEFNQSIQEDKDKYFIQIVQGILRNDGRLIQKELIVRIKDDDSIDMGDNKIKEKLRTYVNKYWKIEQTGEKKNKNTYILIDTVGELISDINNKLVNH